MQKVTVKINQQGLLHQLEISVPEGEVTLMDLVPPMYRLFDKILAIELENYNVVCQKGCSLCCNQLVPISIPEAFYLDALVKSLSPGKQAQIRRRLAVILNRIQAAGFDKLNNPADYRNFDHDYFRLKLNCLFMEADCCSIYEHRPFACRGYYVTSSPQNCGEPYQNQVKKVRIKRNIGVLLAVLAARLYDLPPLPVPLVLFQSWANKNESLRARKWSGIWLFNELMHYLTGFNDEDFQLAVQI